MPAPPYRDPTRPVPERVEDLLSRMTLAEKAGQLFHTIVAYSAAGDDSGSSLGPDRPVDLIQSALLTHLNVLGSPDTAADFAHWHNGIQDLAAATRLGIPVTVSTDPRHAFTDNPGTAMLSGPFSQWPEALGFGAIGDEELVEQFADVARQEYLAVGIRTALHPQVDLATEPRWARASGTFGESAELAGRLGAAYVRGFQAAGRRARRSGLDGTFGTASVSTMAKHFPGSGPLRDGEDSHFAYGREQVYPGGHFATHLAPFRELIAAGTRQLMPAYGMPVGLELDGAPVEPVAFGFNRRILTDVLRESLGFDGIICTDWGLVTDTEAFGHPMPARAWGVEELSRLDRVALILEAGADQLGGESCPELVVQLVRDGRVSEDRIDASVRRLLAEKFTLGLFDDRYVDPAAATVSVGNAGFRAAGRRAQSRAVTVLTNAADGPARLPLGPGLRIYAEGLEPEQVAEHGVPVPRPEEADVAVLRLRAPYEVRGPGFEAFFHAGSLDVDPEVLVRVREVAALVPTVLDVYLDRPAILTDLVPVADTVIASFGAGGAALLDAVCGVVVPEGRLPFDLPRSMAAVEASREDTPHDTADPLFRFGHRVRLG